MIDNVLGLTQHLAPALVIWQRQQGRHHLPWQKTTDPYRVWLSEIMLQQTQVSTVLGYYDRFLQRYPDIQTLAASSLDDVLALWAGLGYYSRARHLHRCAQTIVNNHDGQFPKTAQSLSALPGIGPSTAAAIASFCFHERVSIMDGNVKRVLTRVMAWPADLAVAKNKKMLWDAANTLLPANPIDMPAYTQGLMDLGATLCQRSRTNCSICPWLKWCKAHAMGHPEAYPVNTKKLKRSERESWCLWLEQNNKIWLTQRSATGIWAGLWTMPMFDTLTDMQKVIDLLGCKEETILQEQPTKKHALTHLEWHLHASRLTMPATITTSPLDCGLQGQWVNKNDLHRFGLPAPFKQWLG